MSLERSPLSIKNFFPSLNREIRFLRAALVSILYILFPVGISLLNFIKSLELLVNERAKFLIQFFFAKFIACISF